MTRRKNLKIFGSHNSPNFEEYSAYEQHHTIPNHRTNGKDELDLISILKTLPDQHKAQWRYHIDKINYACTCTKHAASSYTLYNLMFG